MKKPRHTMQRGQKNKNKKWTNSGESAYIAK